MDRWDGKLSYEKRMQWGEALAGSEDRSNSLPQEPARLLGIETGSLVCCEWKSTRLDLSRF